MNQINSDGLQISTKSLTAEMSRGFLASRRSNATDTPWIAPFSTDSTEGMKLLIDQIAQLGGGVAVGGEALNEITMQGQSVAQAHLFHSHHDTCEGLERAGGCPLNAFLFDGLCRTFGYSRLSAKTEEEVLRSRVHLSLGAIPTITGLTAENIRNPSAHLRELFQLANG